MKENRICIELSIAQIEISFIIEFHMSTKGSAYQVTKQSRDTWPSTDFIDASLTAI